MSRGSRDARVLLRTKLGFKEESGNSLLPVYIEEISGPPSFIPSVAKHDLVGNKHCSHCFRADINTAKPNFLLPSGSPPKSNYQILVPLRAGNGFTPRKLSASQLLRNQKQWGGSGGPWTPSSPFRSDKLSPKPSLLGDILFLRMSEDPTRAGEIVVFNVDGRDIPIVHRVIKVHEQKNTGEVYVLTKGDNNDDDDRSLYARCQRWLHRRHIMGRAIGFLPYVGWVTIIMTEKPIIKYILIGALG